jgi:hypothetical protein
MASSNSMLFVQGGRRKKTQAQNVDAQCAAERGYLCKDSTYARLEESYWARDWDSLVVGKIQVRRTVGSF